MGSRLRGSVYCCTQEQRWRIRSQGQAREVKENSPSRPVLSWSYAKGEKAAIEDPTYEIKEITDHRQNKKGKMSYYVIWKDPNVESSWEPVENFDDINIIRKY